MTQGIRKMFAILLLGVVLIGATQAAENDKFEKYKLIVSAFKCNTASETIAKTYLYIGEKIGARQAKKELTNAIKTFDSNFKILDDSINDQKIKNLLVFIKMSYDELVDLIKEPYNLDNAQIVLDLTATVSEGSRHIAELYKKEIGHNDPVNRSGLIPMVESIAKYYIAYQAGIKDDNTIKLMENSVNFCQKLIDVRVKYPKNTVAMNQTINKVNRLWGIVYKFYLDLDEGGLPFIVFKTTTELKEGLKKYADQYKELKKAELKAGK